MPQEGSVPHVVLVFTLLNSYYSANKFLIMFRTGALKKSSIRGTGVPNKHIFWLGEAGEKKRSSKRPIPSIFKGKFEGFPLRPFLVPKTSTLKWLFQLDESKPLLGKWLFHQTSIKKWLAFGFQVVICNGMWRFSEEFWDDKLLGNWNPDSFPIKVVNKKGSLLKR